MTSIFKQVKETLDSKGNWNYYDLCIHVSITKEEKGYIAKTVLADVPFQAKSDDLFELWGILCEFLDAKATQLEYTARAAARFSSIKNFKGFDRTVELDEWFNTKALKLMQ